MSKIDELKFDDKNFNRHTEYGMSLLEKSLRENGAGRSILLDKDNNIIAGNGIIEAAGSVGLENVKIVETQGDEIVAVKRTDVSLNSKQGRKMALADNATAKADIEWDAENLKSEFDDATLKEWVGEQDWLDNEPDEVVEDEAPEVNESEPAASELGKVYQLGKNRLMCGDMNSNNFADGEMAWCSFHTPVRIYKQIWNGMIREGEHENRVHPTQKPIKMLGDILKDFTEPNESILDVFGGSGSTLIACEQLGRKCYMMELDPKYCDVIRKRYWKFKTGSEEGWQDGTKCASGN